MSMDFSIACLHFYPHKHNNLYKKTTHFFPVNNFSSQPLPIHLDGALCETMDLLHEQIVKITVSVKTVGNGLQKRDNIAWSKHHTG